MTDREPASIAGRYDVERRLGAGAFGTVYLVRDSVLGRQLAIKTVRLDALASSGAPLEELMLRFQREARVSAQLKHPNIVTIYDVGEHEGLSYLAMEYIEGQALDDLILSEARLTPTRVAAIGAQVAQALGYAHSQGVVHRDVKPANIMIEAGDRVKVTDFGIAKAQSAEHLTATGNLVGTPAYMSPEQARGGPLDGRSDLFSLGCVLYEMVSGSRAFQADSITGLIFKVITEPPRPLKELAPDAPPELLALVQRALSKAPETRFPSGEAMAEALLAVPDSATGARRGRGVGNEDPTLVNRDRAAGRGPAERPDRPARRRPAIGAREVDPPPRGGSAFTWLLLAAAVGVVALGVARSRRGATPPLTAPAVSADAAEPATPAPPTRLVARRAAPTPIPAAPASPPPTASAPTLPPPAPPPSRQSGSGSPAPEAAADGGSADAASSGPAPWPPPPPPGGRPPPPGLGPPPGAGGPPGSSAAGAESARPLELSAQQALQQVAWAQAQYLQRNQRYGSLVQLRREGLLPGATDARLRELLSSYRLDITAGRTTYRAVAQATERGLRSYEVDQAGTVRSR